MRNTKKKWVKSMSEDIGLINNFIKGYNDIKLSVIDKLSDMNFFSYEAPFLDDGFIEQNIQELEEQYEKACREQYQYNEFSDGDSYSQNKQREVQKRKNSITVRLAFFLSLDRGRIHRAIQLLADIDDSFKICLDAVIQYDNGDYDLALDASFRYIKTLGGIPEHYLFNRNLSELLVKKNDYRMAIPFLRKAIEKKPEEIDLHNKLLLCYRHECMDMEIKTEEQIINLLGV